MQIITNTMDWTGVVFAFAMCTTIQQTIGIKVLVQNIGKGKTPKVLLIQICIFIFMYLFKSRCCYNIGKIKRLQVFCFDFKPRLQCNFSEGH